MSNLRAWVVVNNEGERATRGWGRRTAYVVRGMAERSLRQGDSLVELTPDTTWREFCLAWAAIGWAAVADKCAQELGELLEHNAPLTSWGGIHSLLKSGGWADE